MRGRVNGARASWMAAVVLVCGVLVLAGGAGCRRRGGAPEPEANGFFCPKCQLKFYTDWEVFADKCPGCGNIDLRMVIVYTCTKCGKAILDPSGAPTILCQECKAPAYAGTAPTVQQLTGWGAVKKSKSEVQ